MQRYGNAPEDKTDVQTGMTPTAEFTSLGGVILAGQAVSSGKNIADVAIDVVAHKFKINKAFKNMPKDLKYNTSSGVLLKTNPNKTTTILGSYKQDIKYVLKEIKYPKTLNFNAKKDGFNILNVPKKNYEGMNSKEFWNAYNKPFLDRAIKRGDDIVLATKPTSNVLRNPVTGEKTGFGREMIYLESKGYIYNPQISKMIKVKGN